MADNNNEEIIHGKIEDVDLKRQMEKCYIDYSMSVIIGRALPDVRDGLKPVHRRILYTMNELGLTPDKPFHKSANVVGNTMAYYHPHGDMAIYDTMVRMAQYFSMRYTLVEGKGNFGTMDGDPPAAYRYTEARMSKIALEMLRDINKETVDFRPTYDEKKEEPVVIPSRFPNLLVNGSNGIAVGMATSIPPHNLREVIDGVVELIDNPYATLEDVMKHIKGPDFPTGAICMSKNSIYHAYKTGRGKVTLRAKAKIEEMKNGKSKIIITEIPYQLNKANIVKNIADLVKDKRVDGITEIRDETSKKTGVRIIIETRRDINPEVLLNTLYKHSQLETVYSVILLAIVNGEPKVLSLLEILNHYLEFQKEVITRRTTFDLNKNKDRLHIVKGLLIAIDNIDRVIEIIRSSYENADKKLMEEFSLSEIQATAILDMRLRRLQGLEKEKLSSERDDLMEKIEYFQSILDSKEKLLSVIKEEILEIKDKYGDDRKTTIEDKMEEIDIIDMIEDEEVSITLTHQGYIKRVPTNVYKAQQRGGKGVTSATMKEEDFVEKLLITTNHEEIIFITNKGNIYKKFAYEIPEFSRTAKGTNIVNILELKENEIVSSMVTTSKDEENKYIVMCTKNGIVKKSEISEYKKSNRQGIIAINLDEGDEIVNTVLTDNNAKMFIVTRDGMSILFNLSDLRSIGRVARGVKGISLRKGDEVVSMEIAQDDKDALIISENGYGKRTKITQYSVQNRAGIGVKTYNTTRKTGFVADAKIVDEKDEVMVINSDGTLIRVKADSISQLQRNTQGVKIMRTNDDNKITAIEIIKYDDEEESE